MARTAGPRHEPRATATARTRTAKHERLGDADRAGGDGAQLLAGMIAVALAVEDIIDDIDEARRGAEGGHGQACAEGDVRLRDMPGKERAREADQVFCPLPWAKKP